MLLVAIEIIPVARTNETLTWLNLTSPEKPEQKTDTQEDKTDMGKAPEPTLITPDIPVPEPDVVIAPDFPGLGRMLNNCKLENFAYLTPQQQAWCAPAMVRRENAPAVTGERTKPYRPEDAERWARERAEQKKPKTLPCFGEGGFNPLSPGCLTPSE